MKIKQLRIITTIFNSRGVTEDCIFEDKTVNWTIKEGKKHVMEMAMAFAPESKTNVHQSLSNNNIGNRPHRTYCYGVEVRNGNVQKEFTFHCVLDLT